MLPVLLMAVQVTPARVTLCRVKALLAGPPLREFQVAWTFRTVIESCGLVIVILIVGAPPGALIEPAVMLPQPGTGVEVMVGVNVIVGVKVIVGVNVTVAVGVIEGVSVTVGVFEGVKVITGPSVAVDVTGVLAVDVGGSVDVDVKGILVEVGVFDVPDPEPDPDPDIAPDATSMYPRIVRALIEVISRSGIGTRLINGL